MAVCWLGGRLESGRTLDYLEKPNRKMCSLYLSMMDKLDIRLDQFGDSNERLGEIWVRLQKNRHRLPFCKFFNHTLDISIPACDHSCQHQQTKHGIFGWWSQTTGLSQFLTNQISQQFGSLSNTTSKNDSTPILRRASTWAQLSVVPETKKKR